MGHITNCSYGAVPASLSDAKGCLAVDVQEYATAQDMMQSTCLKAGYAHTLGFYEVGDGGAAYYTVGDSGTPNGMDVLRCAKGLCAELIEGTVANQYGATGKTDDCSTIFNYILSNRQLNLLNNVYRVSQPIIVKSSINGNNGTIESSTAGNVITIENISEIEVNDLTINGDAVWDGTNLMPHNVQNGIFISTSHSLTFKNVTVNRCGSNGMYLVQKSWNIYFYNCEFFNNGNDGFNGINNEINPAESNATTLYFYGCKFRHNIESGITINGYCVNFYGGVIEQNKIGIKFQQTDNTGGEILFDGTDIEGNVDYAVLFMRNNVNNKGSFENITFNTCQIYGSNTNISLINVDYNNLIVINLLFYNTVLNTPNGMVASGSESIIASNRKLYNLGDVKGVTIIPPFNAIKEINATPDNFLSKFRLTGGLQCEIINGQACSLLLDCSSIMTLSFNCSVTSDVLVKAYNVVNGQIVTDYTYTPTIVNGIASVNFGELYTNRVDIYYTGSDSCVVSNVKFSGKMEA